MATYGIGFTHDKAEYYVVIDGKRVEQVFAAVEDALVYIDGHAAAQRAAQEGK